MTMGDEMQCLGRGRRNGLWNIFEGLDLEVLGKLGLSEDVLKQLLALDAAPSRCTSACSVRLVDNVEEMHSQALLRALSAASSESRRPSFASVYGQDAAICDSSMQPPLPAPTDMPNGDGQADYPCGCERARLYRSLSASVSEELVRHAVQNRHRRNAVGNLFEILTPVQQLVLVERLQAELHRFGFYPVAEGSSSMTTSSASSVGGAAPSSPQASPQVVSII